MCNSYFLAAGGVQKTRAQMNIICSAELKKATFCISWKIGQNNATLEALRVQNYL